MKLRELSVQTLQKHKYQNDFNPGVWCIQEMYWYQLRNIKTKNIAKVVVILGDKENIRRFGNVLSISRPFNFDNYFQANDYERKKIILEMLNNELLAISSEQGIDKKMIESAYNYCIDNNLENRWILKNKYFKSPNNKFYGAMECNWKPDKFFVTGIIFDQKKSELYRRLIVEKKPYFGDFIYYCKCGWEQNIFYLESEEKERWEINLDHFERP